jgi:hypothetical protein
VKTFSYLTTIIAFILLFFSCQKEIHFDFISEGTLEKDANNNCLSQSHGDFVAGKNLSSNNYLTVQVGITAHGNYSISSDTVNGYWFEATGEFKDTGFISVKLAGHGKPNAAGNDQFNITYNSSHCQVAVSVSTSSNSGGGTGDGAASFTLQGAPGACMIDTISGTYLSGQILDTSNKLNIEVNVTKAGSYSISTDTVNGYSFSSSGNFSTTGVQVVVLNGKGNPVNAGNDAFAVTAGSSSCTFSNNVLSAVAVTNPDHFPLTMSSYWDYNDLYYSGNVITNIIIGPSQQNGKSYQTMERDISPGGPLILYYRRSGSDYFEYTTVDKYTGSVKYAKKIYDDLPFLKEGLVTGQQWSSNEYKDTASFGQVILLQYDFACLDANATVIINGHAFVNVYKVEMRPTIAAVGNAYHGTGEVYTSYYAKGVGLIYYKETNLGSSYGEQQIKDWQVN